MLVGKRGGRESCRQEDINAMMLTYARAGKRVVRLKAGDPSVFGRAGEEIAHLERAGIPVSVVPGITAASALAAGANISLTHRDCAQSVRFVTGHSRKGTLPDSLDWRAIADPTASTVFYMGGRTAYGIMTHLLAAGMPVETPVVVAANVSRKDERRWFGTLEAALHLGGREFAQLRRQRGQCHFAQRTLVIIRSKCNQLLPGGTQGRYALQGAGHGANLAWIQFSGGLCRRRVPDHPQGFALAQWHTHQCAGREYRLTSITQHRPQGGMRRGLDENAEPVGHGAGMWFVWQRTGRNATWGNVLRWICENNAKYLI